MTARTSRCAAFVLAAAFANVGLGQTPAAPGPPAGDAGETIAAADQLAATAGGGGEAPSASAAPPAWTSDAAAAPSPGSKLAKWIGVESDDVRWFRLGRWEGNLGVTYNRSQQETNFAGPKTVSRLWTEYLSVRNDGWSILDPRFITGGIGVTVGLGQEKQTFGEGSQSQTGHILGYSFDATLFGQKALNARLWADQVEGYTTLPFVGTLTSTISTAGVMVNLLQHSWLRDAEILPWFDAKLEVYQQRLLQQYNYGTSSPSYKQIQDVARLDAHNGTETSDLNASLQFIDFQFPTFPTGSYRSTGATLWYSGDFGADLGTTWTSSIAYNNRTGDIPLETFAVGQTLDVHHYADVESTYTYNLLQQRSGASSIVNQNGSANIVGTIWRHLSLNAGASGIYSRYPAGTVEGATGSLGLDYTRGLPGNGTVDVNLQGNYAWVSDNLSSGDISVIDEANSAPSTLGVGSGFLLNFPFVVASSIVVVDTRGGARLPTTINLDYTIAPDGNKTRIVVLPTSRVIQPGDPLAISYIYVLPAQTTYHSSSKSATLGVDYGWFGLTYNHTQTETPELTQGSVMFVGNSTSDSILGALRYNSELLNVGFIANVIRFDATTLAYDTESYSAGVGWSPSWLFGLNFSAGWSKTDYTLPLPRTSGASTARLDLNFYPPSVLFNDVLTATIYGLRNRLTDSMLPTQTLTAVGANMKYMLGKLTFVAGGQYGKFENGTSNMRNLLFNLSLNRRF